MKTSRYILLISVVLTIISSISILFISKELKFYDILMGLMTGAFISFMLEIPHYAKIKSENYKLLFFSLFNLKSHLAIFNNILEKCLRDNIIVTDKFPDSHIQVLLNDLTVLQNFDTDYFIKTDKKENSTILINDIADKLNILSQYTNAYSIAYYTKQIEHIKTTGQNLNITADLIANEIQSISELCESYSKDIDINIKMLLSKKQYNKWTILSEKIKNTSYNFKINK